MSLALSLDRSEKLRHGVESEQRREGRKQEDACLTRRQKPLNAGGSIVCDEMSKRFT